MALEILHHPAKTSIQPVKLDGRTGEGGGQVVRIAACLAALTGTPLKIENVRGNRPGKNRGGKSAGSLTCKSRNLTKLRIESTTCCWD